MCLQCEAISVLFRQVEQMKWCNLPSKSKNCAPERPDRKRKPKRRHVTAWDENGLVQIQVGERAAQKQQNKRLRLLADCHRELTVTCMYA